MGDSARALGVLPSARLDIALAEVDLRCLQYDEAVPQTGNDQSRLRRAVLMMAAVAKHAPDALYSEASTASDAATSAVDDLRDCGEPHFAERLRRLLARR